MFFFTKTNLEKNLENIFLEKTIVKIFFSFFARGGGGNYQTIFGTVPYQLCFIFCFRFDPAWNISQLHELKSDNFENKTRDFKKKEQKYTNASLDPFDTIVFPRTNFDGKNI